MYPDSLNMYVNTDQEEHSDVKQRGSSAAMIELRSGGSKQFSFS